MKTTVIHHSADYDGIFCREIARKFLPGAELIGWDFGNDPLPFPDTGKVYVLDLPVAPQVFSAAFANMAVDNSKIPLFSQSDVDRIIWIDHHRTSIESHPKEIPGYRIEGVAACRLAWFYFTALARYTEQTVTADFTWFHGHYPWATKQDFIDRKVDEPLAVRLAGEYDVWDHRRDGDLEFQFGLDAQDPIEWPELLTVGEIGNMHAESVVTAGHYAMRCYAKRDADVMRMRSFKLKWEGLTFLALNTAKCNSNTFAALDKPETGHDALMAFFYTGRGFRFSLYHAAHRKDIDLSQIAKKHGGGGHPGACGFECKSIEFITNP